MKLSIAMQESLTQKIKTTFYLKDSQAQTFIESLSDTLEGKNEHFFYHLKYIIYFDNSQNLIEKVIRFAIESYTLLMAGSECRKKSKEIEDFYYHFFKIIFIERCTYAKKLEKRRDSVQNILEHVSARLDDSLQTQQLMIANISHEMRTSLNAISGYLALIKTETFENEIDRGYFSKASYATGMLKALVSDILDVSKMNSGQLEMKEEPFWLDEMVLKCIDTIALPLKKKEIGFDTHIDLFPARLNGDHYHIMEVLTNLLSNAIKYTDRGTVSLSVEIEDETEESISVMFCVEDTGIGMTEEELKILFDPYSRFATQREGVGLGLHIASRLVKKLGGELNVTSKRHHGSKFWFSSRINKLKEVNKTNFGSSNLYFFNNQVNHKNIEAKFAFLKQFGASVKQFDDEQSFTSHLLNLREDIPNIICINTNSEEYSRYDALINYLKSTQRFNKTLFIAEETEERLPLTHFDKINERFTPISIYIEALQKKNSSREDMTPLEEKEIRILAVDDMETNLEILKLFIINRYPQAKIDLAMGGYEAIGMYKTGSYDIIFMDLKMPGQSGYEVLKKLRLLRPTELPPTYALTADVYKSTYERVMEVGFTGLLEKPLQLDLLFESIEKAVK